MVAVVDMVRIVHFLIQQFFFRPAFSSKPFSGLDLTRLKERLTEVKSLVKSVFPTTDGCRLAFCKTIPESSTFLIWFRSFKTLHLNDDDQTE